MFQVQWCVFISVDKELADYFLELANFIAKPSGFSIKRTSISMVGRVFPLEFANPDAVTIEITPDPGKECCIDRQLHAILTGMRIVYYMKAPSALSEEPEFDDATEARFGCL